MGFKEVIMVLLKVSYTRLKKKNTLFQSESDHPQQLKAEREGANTMSYSNNIGYRCSEPGCYYQTPSSLSSRQAHERWLRDHIQEKHVIPAKAEAAVRASPLYCYVSGCRWKTPQGVSDYTTQVELMKLHTQQLHQAVGLPGDGGGTGNYQGGGDGGVHNYQMGREARSRAEQLNEIRRFREEGRARRAAYTAAAGPVPLSCSAPGCQWRTPQGVGDLTIMVELMRLHTQQAHQAPGLSGGGGAAGRYHGGGGGGEHNYPAGHKARSRAEQVDEIRRFREEGRARRAGSQTEGAAGGRYIYPDRRQDRGTEEGHKQPTAPPPPCYEELFAPSESDDSYV